MSAHLIIRDGLSQWWLSPDIWVVPGNDPNGAAGAPVAGGPAYLWARLANTGTSPAYGARVDFYWADPSAQVVVGVATQVGSAYADLDPGDTQDVLCLVPWLPVIVNGGHECLLAVAHGAGDLNPIPDPLPNGYAFDPPAHDQIAQRNISVLSAARLGAPLAIAVHALPRVDKRAQVALSYGGELDERLLEQLGLRQLRPAKEPAVEAWLSREARCGDADDKERGQQELNLEVARGTAAAVFVNLRARDLPHGHYQLIHVIERAAGKVVGGVSYVIVNAHEEQTT